MVQIKDNKSNVSVGNKNNKSNASLHKINDEIRSFKVRLVLEDGTAEVLSLRDALQKADDEGLDLVEMNVDSQVSVCKLMDYGKYKFNLQKKKKETNRKQKEASKKQKLKELYVHLAIAEHDYQVRLKQLNSFIAEGMRVKLGVKLRGREMAYSQQALALLNRFYTDTGEENVKLDMAPKMEGNNANVIFSPVANK